MKKILLFAVISVLIVSVSVTSISAQSQYEIPSWVKGIAGFWAEDKITDSEFGEGLSFLIDNGIIKVPLIQELQNKITQLESELHDEIDQFTFEFSQNMNDPKGAKRRREIVKEFQETIASSELLTSMADNLRKQLFPQEQKEEVVNNGKLT